MPRLVKVLYFRLGAGTIELFMGIDDLILADRFGFEELCIDKVWVDDFVGLVFHVSFASLGVHQVQVKLDLVHLSLQREEGHLKEEIDVLMTAVPKSGRVTTLDNLVAQIDHDSRRQLLPPERLLEHLKGLSVSIDDLLVPELVSMALLLVLFILA